MPNFELRLRRALYILKRWSLVTYYEEKNSWSVHSLVHVWVRERPQMTLGEQTVWSQAAASALGQAILLPTGTPTTQDMGFQRSLLLHIIDLRARQKEIREQYCNTQNARMRVFPIVKPASDLIVTDRPQAKQAAKFSYIYFVCSYYTEAEKLQRAVRDFLVPNLGLEHEFSMRISLFLAETYVLNGGRINDAAILIEKVFQAVEKSLGDRYIKTLKIMDALGTIRNDQARFPEADDLLQRVIEERTEVLGENHEDTLCSIDNLGQVYWNMFAYEEAKN